MSRLDDFKNATPSDSPDRFAESDMRADMDYSQCGAEKEYADPLRLGAFGEKFRVSGVGETGCEFCPFIERCGVDRDHVVPHR